uniref:Uncharacterized protein n=1 Tax=Oryza rufipogon TaxID=4529 RepID=A0A0E0MVQ1_ORYRU
MGGGGGAAARAAAGGRRRCGEQLHGRKPAAGGMVAFVNGTFTMEMMMRLLEENESDMAQPQVGDVGDATDSGTEVAKSPRRNGQLLVGEKT